MCANMTEICELLFFVVELPIHLINKCEYFTFVSLSGDLVYEFPVFLRTDLRHNVFRIADPFLKKSML